MGTPDLSWAGWHLAWFARWIRNRHVILNRVDSLELTVIGVSHKVGLSPLLFIGGDFFVAVTIHLTIEPERGRPVSVARVCDPQILRQVARAAILQARRRADVARSRDVTLGRLCSDEADTLEKHLSELVSGLATCSAVQ